MLTRAEAIAACLSLPDSYEDYPFGDPNWTIMRRQTNRRMFAAIFEREGRIWINVKAEPGWGDFFRSVYPAVVPAYHMNKLHWISIILDGSMTDAEILPLIDDSYRLVGPRPQRRRTTADEASDATHIPKEK